MSEEIISFIDFTNMSDEEKYKLLNKKDKEIERLNNIIKEQGLEDKPNYYVKGLEGSLKEYQQEVVRLNNIINEINSIVEYWGYDKEHNDISSFRMAMKKIKEVLGSDKE